MSKSYQPIKITFHFPKFFGKSKKNFIKAIADSVPLDSNIGHAGFLYKKYLREEFAQRYFHSDIETYQSLTLAQKEKITRILLTTAKESSQVLPPPTGQISVFVFPWLGPFDNHDRAMGFSTGFCPYKNVVLIFLSPKLFILQSLRGSLAHEYNHAVFFNHHDMQQTLLNTIIFEGLAQNFEEEVVNAGPPPYGTILTNKEGMNLFNTMSPRILHSKNHNLYRHVFFGGKKYKKWTGYSIGYWIVKAFKKKNQNLSWQEIMKMEPPEIVRTSGFTKE